MNSALKMPLEMPKAPLVPGRPDPDSMQNVQYSDAISEQFNNILDQRSRLMSMQPTLEQVPMPYQMPMQVEPQRSDTTPLRSDPVEQYMQQNSMPAAQPQVQVVRRNLTVAELGALFIVAVIAVGTVQAVWNIVPKPVVTVEWRR